MEWKRNRLNNGFKVTKHSALSRASEAELIKNALTVFSDADQGIQTAIVSKDGKTVRAVVGLNGTRYLPDPNPDPLDEIVRQVLESKKVEGQ